MVKIIYLLIISLSLHIIGCNSLSIVNNVTVPRDVLSNLFFNEIRNNANLFNISTENTNDYNAMKCILSLQQLLSQLPSLNVLSFFDAWGSIPSGILRLHLVDIGNFDQCLGISVKLNEVTGVVNGQHCFASIPLISAQSFKNPLIDTTALNERSAMTDLLRIRVGICIPDICSPEVITSVLKTATSNVFNGALSGLSVGQCHVAKRPDHTGVEIAGIAIFSIFLALLFFSSVYDFFMDYFNKTPIALLLAFSLLSNGKKLFAINTTKSPNSITSIIGIRVLSMVWVLYGHCFAFSLATPLINTIDILAWTKQFWSMHLLNATVSVDSFFFLSGLLVAWVGFQELDRTKGKLNVVLMYVHRYIRLTPPVAAIVLFLISLDKMIGVGPFRELFMVLNGDCTEKWWSTLLYVQNYVNPDSICITQSWYLAIDFQLFILSPLILIPMWKWGKKFSPVLLVLSLLSIGCIIATYFKEGYTGLIGLTGENQQRLTYFPTHTRYSPWLVGIGLGYYMYINRQRTFHLSKMVQLLGWVASIAILMAVIFGPYHRYKSDDSATVFEAAMYESLKRVSWSIALAWIVFACQFGFGGIVNTILSHPIWQPFGRLTYSLYLVHISVMGIIFGSLQTNVYFSDFRSILNFWAAFGISLIAAITLTLAFEAPILILEKAIFSRGASKQNGIAPVVAASNDITVEVPRNKTA